MYSEKFDEFQVTVSKSNGVYASFKQDMDKVSITPLVHVAYYHVISKHGDHVLCTRFMLESCLLDVEEDEEAGEGVSFLEIPL